MLSRLSILACLLLAGLLAACPPARGEPSVLEHRLALRIDPEQRLLAGSATLLLDGAGELSLRLAPQAAIRSVESPRGALPYRFENGRLEIDLSEGGVDQLTIAYQAVFADPIPVNPVHTEDPTYGVAATITDAGAFLSGRAGWYPLRPGEASVVHLEISAPSGMPAVTEGRLVGMDTENGRTVSRWEVERPVSGLTLAAGRWEVERADAGDIPVYTFFAPERQALANRYLEASVRYLDLYRERFGPYPYDKFAVVENFFPTGYGFPSWTLLGSTVVRLPFILDTSLPHEIAHSWWGTWVEPDPARGNWSEGLATYVADHYVKELGDPEEARRYRLKILRDYAALVQPEEDFPLRDFTSRRSAVSQAVGYGKSAMVFHMARQRVGDRAFWQGLRSVAGEHGHGRASWSDFSAALGKAGGTDLEAFMEQWVERPGAPHLALEGVEAKPHDGRWQVRGELVQGQQQAYMLQVPLLLETVGEPVRTLVTATGRITPFLLESRDPPRRLTADPEVDLFRRLQPGEIPPTVNSVRGSDALLVVRCASLPEEAEKGARLLLAALRQEGAEVIAEAEASREALRDRDLLFLGLPRPSLRPPLPAELELGEERIVLRGTAYADPDTVLFTALPHPVQPERAAGIFLPLGSIDGSTAARKIPHYGKYSYLVFVGGENQAKGTWSPAESPLIHFFEP